MCEVNFVVSSITIICGIYLDMYYINIKILTLSYDKYHTIYLFWAQIKEYYKVVKNILKNLKTLKLL